jgi:hypothetical protein
MVFVNANCRALTPEYVNTASPSDLHRFAWTSDDTIGELDPKWNWLVGEFEKNPDARVLHYTLGTPCFLQYRDCDHAEEWFAELQAMNAPLEWWIKDTNWGQKRPPRLEDYPFCASKVYPLGNPSA